MPAAATIIFMDIENFSKKPTIIQKQLIDSLNSEVLTLVRTFLKTPLNKPEIIALPTGDGMVLTFLHSTKQHWDTRLIFQLMALLHEWMNTYHPYVLGRSNAEMRIGVHQGVVELISDINGNSNVCGDTINYTQRIMEASKPHQALFSTVSYRAFAGEGVDKITVEYKGKNYTFSFGEPIEIHIKHSHISEVRNLRLDVIKPIAPMTDKPFQVAEPQSNTNINLEGWDNSAPDRYKQVRAELCVENDSREEQLQKSTEIALVHIAGEPMLNLLKEMNSTFKSLDSQDPLNADNRETPKNKVKLTSLELKEWYNNARTLWVIMPNESTLEMMRCHPKHYATGRMSSMIRSWWEVLREVKTYSPNADVRLRIVNEVLFFGGTYFNWNKSGGVIHFYPNMRGLQAAEYPVFYLEWKGKTYPTVYRKFVDALYGLRAHSKDCVLENDFSEPTFE